MIYQYVRRSVRQSVYPVHCGKTADRIRMLFGITGWTGPGMRQVVGLEDRSTGRGTFRGKFGACHCNQWGFYGICVRQRRNAALFLNYFGQTCCSYSLSFCCLLLKQQINPLIDSQLCGKADLPRLTWNQVLLQFFQSDDHPDG